MNLRIDIASYELPSQLLNYIYFVNTKFTSNLVGREKAYCIFPFFHEYHVLVVLI